MIASINQNEKSRRTHHLDQPKSKPTTSPSSPRTLIPPITGWSLRVPNLSRPVTCQRSSVPKTFADNSAQRSASEPPRASQHNINDLDPSIRRSLLPPPTGNWKESPLPIPERGATSHILSPVLMSIYRYCYCSYTIIIYFVCLLIPRRRRRRRWRRKKRKKEKRPPPGPIVRV